MKFIEELTLMHKAAIGATIPLLIMLLLVSARRRKAAAAPSDASPAPVATTSGRPGRVKETAALPRRKRRKLAVEAANAMGVAATPVATAAPEVPAINVPEVTVAQAIEPQIDETIEAAFVAQPTADEPVAIAVTDDPYLQDARLGDAGAFVAQPGWPSPGELASSFDPDAFDPLPEMHEPQQDESLYDEAPEAIAYEDTHAIELPDLSTANEVTALAEIEEWADTAEAGADWDDTDDTDLTEDNWTISEPQPEPQVVAARSEPMDLEDVWSEPDDEPLWNQEGEVGPTSEEVVDLDTALAETPTFETSLADDTTIDVPSADDATFDLPAAGDRTFDVAAVAWVDGSPSAWQVTDVPAPAPQTVVPAGWSGAIGGQGSPVVLDLAGLAASGQSLELIIEPNADGHGVRLRFGAPAPTPVDAPAATTAGLEGPVADAPIASHADARFALQDEAEVDEVAAVAEHDTTVWDVPFLAGIAPVDEPKMVADLVEPAGASVPVQAKYTVVEPPEVSEAVVTETPEPAASEPAVAEPTITFVDQVPPSTFEAAAYHGDALAFDLEPSGPSNASAVMDADDDPARILADIRARLAALDAQR